LRETELIIVGGGPGGIAAAIMAAQAGLEVTLLDENASLGGQVYRRPEKGFRLTGQAGFGPDCKEAQALLNRFDLLKDKIRHLNNAMVWGIFKDRKLAFVRNGVSFTLGFNQLVVATGAYDRPVPFPGWTLPGVFTAGGAQKLVKSDRVLPGRRILLAGTGPLQLVLAHQIIEAGGKIEAILEAGRIGRNWLRGLKGAWGNWPFLTEGIRYLRSIRKAGVPLLRSHMILEARGGEQVEAAVISEVDGNWRPKADRARTIEVDAICIGYGLVSSSEMSLLAGCEHFYDPGRGGHIPVRKPNLETSVPGIFAIGDGAGVAGRKVAVEEGAIAGLSAAAALGCMSKSEAQRRIKRHQGQLLKINRLRKFLDDISFPRVGLYELAADDTVICRCEEVTLAQVNAALGKNTLHLKDLKRMTRLGMGSCEGRMCGPAMVELMRHRLDVSPEDVGYLMPRPAIKPVALGALAKQGRCP
jgi:thioredoxin reductase